MSRRLSILTVLVMLAAVSACANEADRYVGERQTMVRTQLQLRDVSDPVVLGAMEKVKRHLFVPDSIREMAYEDTPLPIGHNQTISQPYIVAYMTEAARLKKTDRVLEIGTGSGYQAAVLGEIVREVYTIEIVEELADTARKRLADLGYKNITVRHGDGYQGWPEKAPFDAIIVTAAPDRVPEKLLEQLAEGGRMVIPIGSFFQNLFLYTKKDGAIRRQKLLPVRFVPMVESEAA